MNDEDIELKNEDDQDFDIVEDQSAPVVEQETVQASSLTKEDVQDVVTQAIAAIPREAKGDEVQEDENLDYFEQLKKETRAEAIKGAEEKAAQVALSLAAPSLRRELFAQGKELLGEYADDTALSELRSLIDGVDPGALAAAASNPKLLEESVYSIIGKRVATRQTFKPVGSSTAPSNTTVQPSNVIALKPQDREDYQDMMEMAKGLSEERIKRLKKEFLAERGYVGAR